MSLDSPSVTPSVTPLGAPVRPTPDQVLLLAPDRASAAAATAAADPAAWSAAGCDHAAVWGYYIATSAEPYEVAIDLTAPAFRCSCPSRKVPCKHALGLLLMHAEQRVATVARLGFAEVWMQRRDAHPSTHQRAEAPDPAGSGAADVAVGEAPAIGRLAPLGGGRDPQRDRRQLERADRMRAGVIELDTWLADRVRTGLATPELADPLTWQRLAARLVDAQCGALANRVKRVAALVGQRTSWHHDVLEEMAVLHGLARGALRTSMLPPDLRDGVHAATGLTVTTAEVLAGVPTTATWMLAGVSRVREDMITVQRSWWCTMPCESSSAAGDSTPSSTWAMVLAFGAVGREVTSEHPIGTRVTADVHWYPGAVALRALVGRVHDHPAASSGVLASAPPTGTTLAAGVGAAGWACAAEPWLERAPVCVVATPRPIGDGRWTLTDHTGSIAIVPGFWRLAELVSMSGGEPLTVMGEHSVDGILPLTAWSQGVPVVLS